ncbi:CHAP domain-containing protein (plasmid) [Falsirhodobacter algicola]|uniref:CHAP domain-containing protein n=2 Tax=Falsirhodobacter algicola TaxID=2692330 RepID=A0A8J8MVK9_9RHOB|nr:CHAP domain-containing protein [Falsirhodobacter algicola]
MLCSAVTAMAEPQPVLVAQLTRAELTQAVAEADADIRASGVRRIWCVPFARAVSGIEIRGNAGTWWNAAAGRYPRGNVPIPGAVLNFRSTSKMPMGHVAVVSSVIDSRRITVTQANWVRNRVTEDVVIDISPKNDWSQVRVENRSNSFGSPYPTYGFIYRPAPVQRAVG